MAYRTRIKYTAKQKVDIWDRWQRGEPLRSIGRLFDRPSSSIFNLLEPTGGIRTAPRNRSGFALTQSEREEISRGTVANLSIRSIAENLKRSASAISRKIIRNGGYDSYRANKLEPNAYLNYLFEQLPLAKSEQALIKLLRQHLKTSDLNR